MTLSAEFWTGAAFTRWHSARAASLDAGLLAADRGNAFAALSRSFRLFLQSAILGLGAWLALGGVGLDTVPGTGAWWASRPLWIAVYILALLPMIGVFARHERSFGPIRGGRTVPRLRAVLVHLPAGWFVVGLGRNGMEYSVLLIACLLLVGWQHRRRPAPAEGVPT